ncbi:MAG: RNA polymerase sigma factor, partial [Bacteroidetes bacterium]|nr:RNA polymerase sigma factor [Bacteroidota bacterium]
EIRINPDKFEKIYNQHYQTIFNYCYRRTGDFDTSKDITSEIFLKAYLNIHKFKWKDIPILSWLYRIATNEINLFYRSQKYSPTFISEIYSNYSITVSLEDLVEEKSNAEAKLHKDKQFVQVQDAIKELPLKYQEVISLKYFEQLKIKEIGTILNKKEGTIKSLLSRGISKLKEKM